MSQSDQAESSKFDDIQMLTLDDVAGVLKLNRRTIYRKIQAGEMPQPARIGGVQRWSKAALQQWIDEGCPTVRAS